MPRKFHTLIALAFYFTVNCAMAQTAAPKVLLISDIDDTIKVAHVLNKAGQIVRATDTTTPFRGMAPLYQLIINQNPSSTKIAYISNAPKTAGAIPYVPQFLADLPAANVLHQSFLDSNRFPKGELILREDLRDKMHKTNAIHQLIAKEKPDVVILIGDNGESDMDYYKQATDEYAANKNMQVVTFIHQLYKSQASSFFPAAFQEMGRAIYPEQTGFVTPIEIALKLNELHLLGQDKVDWLIQHVMPDIVQETQLKLNVAQPITFPTFKNCEDFKWSFSRPQQLQSLIQKIEEQCR